jgi:hypothetical protein
LLCRHDPGQFLFPSLVTVWCTGGAVAQGHAYFSNGIQQTLAALPFRVEGQLERRQQRVPVQHFEKIARVD